jgi:hypothetical protein
MLTVLRIDVERRESDQGLFCALQHFVEYSPDCTKRFRDGIARLLNQPFCVFAEQCLDLYRSRKPKWLDRLFSYVIRWLKERG